MLYPIEYSLDKVDVLSVCEGCLVISLVLAQRSDPKGSRWTVKVQRLLQPTRELVRSGYKTGLRVKELLLPGD